MGRGIAAAAVMGQLRATVRACALVEESPAAVLGLVDAAMSSLDQTSLTTCLYGVFDPATRLLRLASSGHLPPLVVHVDGGGEYVELDPGPPLGVGTSRPHEVEVEVPDGAVLLLFTDGLVEGRNQPVEDGMHVLRGAVSERRTDPCDVEGLCDELLRAMGRDGRPDDDSALLAVVDRPTPGASAATPASTCTWPVTCPRWPRARRLVCDAARRSRGRRRRRRAARHRGGDQRAAARRAGRGPVAAPGSRAAACGSRSSTAGPRRCRRCRRPTDDAEGGRGLLLVSALARDWGTDRLSAGKCVWFELGPAPAA